MSIKIPFIDFKTQQALIQDELAERSQRVYAHARFVLGPEVFELESALAKRTQANNTQAENTQAENTQAKNVQAKNVQDKNVQAKNVQAKNVQAENTQAKNVQAKNVIACANGTDALYLLLRAEEIGRGDAVFVPAFTFAATAAAVVLCGATPFFVDILEDFTLDPQSLKLAITEAREKGLKAKAVIPVDLYGLPADYDAIAEIASEEKLLLFVDAAQSFSAEYKGQKTTALGDGAMTSFFPTKPLACYGDGGAVFTQDEERAHKVRMLANHGQVLGKRYCHELVGINSRLDSLQAAVLMAKLTIFDDEIKARQLVAETYNKLLADKVPLVITPRVPAERVSVWGQYTIRSAIRDKISEVCSQHGVASIVHYPSPLYEQVAYKNYPVVSVGTPRAEKAAREVLSLPMHPYLKEEQQRVVVEAIAAAFA